MSNRLIQTISLNDEGYSKGVKSAREALEKLGKENGVVNNSFRSTSKELNSAKKFYSQLTSEYNNLSDSAKKGEFGRAMHAQIEQTRKDLKRLMEDTARTKKELADMQEEANKKVSGGKGGFLGGGMLDKLGMGQLKNFGGGGKLAGATGALAGTVAVVGVLGKVYWEAAKAYAPFESSLSNLQAITGVSSKELENFKTKIKETGIETSKAFTEVTDAYTKVGSAMPELLKDADALDAVTRAAITLSKASRMDLDSAINSLTGIMNQFGASASQADRYINVLAAGAKEGSAGIEYLSQALDKCGTSLATTNMSVEQGTALLEVLAKKIPDASTAGTNLRNILIKMSQAQDKYNPKVVGMTQALQNLQPKIKDTAFMVKMFGAENVNAAITLAQAVDTYDDLTKKVTGTNEAFNQAGVQTDNFESAVKRLNTSWDNFMASLLNSIKPLTKIVNLLSDAIDKAAKAHNIRTFVDKFNNENGKSDDYQKKETRDEQWAAWQKRRGNLSAEISKIQNHLTEAERKRDTAKTGTDWHQAKDLVERLTKSLKDAKDLRDKEAKAAYKFFYGDSKKEVTQTTTETTTTTNTKTKTKSPREVYDETIKSLYAQLANELITQKEYLEKQKSAIQTYINALSKTEKSVKQNASLIKSLNGKIKTIDAELKVIEQREKDEKTISDANEKYAKTIKQIERDRQNGFIDEKEYQTSYISAIKELIKSYSKVENLTDDLINTVKAKQKEIKDFELHQLEKTLIRNNLDRNAQVEKIYNNGRIERQAPANDAYKQKESAFNYLLGISNPVSLSGIVDLEDIYKNPGHKMTEKEERWYKEYKSFLGENKALLGDMDAEVNNIYDAMNLIRKLDLAMAFKDFVDQGKSAQEFMMRYFDNIKSVGIDLGFDKEGAIKKYNEIANSNLPIEEKYKQVAEVERVADEAAKRMADKLSKYIFPQPFGKGDASNYSLTGNTSYFKVSESANKYNYGAGRLDENLMDDRITQKMNDDMTALLEKYKDIEDLYVKANMEAEKNSDTKWLATNYSEELDELEKQINNLHNKIQDRLTFQLKIEGAQDALGGLNNFASIGSNLASIPDTLDSIAESSNDAAAAFQYFGVIINSVQDIIDGIKVTMEIYKALQDLFTVSTQAQNLAIQDNAASQVQQAATTEANTLAKTTETVANKALEASVLDLAAAEIFAAHAYIPFAGVPIATANVGAMMGSMAGVHATSLGLTAMANGGIVGGMQFSGDATLIRANKGEMVLNREQQANLFSLLDSPSARGGVKGDVRFEIQGDKLVGVLNNHNRYHSKSGNKLKL